MLFHEIQDGEAFEDQEGNANATANGPVNIVKREFVPLVKEVCPSPPAFRHFEICNAV